MKLEEKLVGTTTTVANDQGLAEIALPAVYQINVQASCGNIAKIFPEI